jgi:polyisoprenoid-binding protein YceI
MPRPRTRYRSGWRVALAAAAWCALVPPAQGTDLYRIDQRFGTIDFAVGVLGLFSVDGRFPEFAGELVLDVDQPQRSSIDVTVRTDTLTMPAPEQVELLRSEPYFDTARHPTARFVSLTVEPLSPTHYAIRGALTLRGVSRPLELDARLEGRRRDQGRGAEVADFVVTGALKRSEFGMVADRPMLADEVTLTIRIRLAIGVEPGGG